jgi:hypothetical protein
VFTSGKPTGWSVGVNYGGVGNNNITLTAYVLCGPGS